MSASLISRKLTSFLTLALCLASVATAQEELLTKAPDEFRAYGTVADEDGNPIASAKASLVTLQLEPSTLTELLYRKPAVASDSSAEDGTFDIRIPGSDARWNAVNDRTQHLLIVEAIGYETSVIKFTRERLWVDLPFSITANACQPWTLKVLDKDGVAVTDLKLSVGQIHGHRLPFKFEMANSIEVGEGGLYEIRNISQDSLAGIYLSGKSPETFGSFFLPVQATEKVPFVQLPETGTVKGTFTTPESASPASLAGKEVIIASGNLYVANETPRETISWAVLRLDENASATATNVFFGPTMFGFVNPSSVPFCQSIKDLANSTLSKENSPLEISHKLYPSKKIEIEFENESGESITNVQISSFAGTTSGENKKGTVTITIPVDEKPSGQMFPFDPSNEYQVTSGFGVMLDRLEMENGKPKPVTMTRSRSIKGRVTDEQGQTVAGAKVEFTYATGRFSLTKSVFSNLSGDFHIDGLPPNANVTLKASKEDLATPEDANISVTSGDAEEVLLPVVTQVVAAIAGKVTDQQGTPIANAKVTIQMANVFQKEGYSGEQVGGVDLIPDFAGVVSDADGNFEYPATTKYGKRLQVIVNAPGFRSQRFPFIDGSQKNIGEQSIHLGTFPLFKVPVRKSTVATVVDEGNGEPIEGATLVFVGIDSTKQVAVTDQQGRATMNAEDTRQLLAVKADGYELKLRVLENVADTIRVSLTPTGNDNAQVSWLDKDWKHFHEPGRKLMEKLEAPKPKESTFYRQNTFFSSQINSDFKAFREAMKLPYQEQESLLFLNVVPVFLNAPTEATKLLISKGADTRMKAVSLAQFAMLSEDEDAKEEFYGEAIIHAGECSGAMRLLAFGQISSSLVVDGKIEVAKELIAEAWESSDADELKEQFESKTAMVRIIEARGFAPTLGLVDADNAIELIRLTSMENEAPGLIAKCLFYSSMAGEENIEAICKNRNVEFKATGLAAILRSVEMSNVSYPAMANWIEEHVEQMPDSYEKVFAAMLAARHLPEGQKRKKLIQLIAAARKACHPFYHYDDPAKGILEELPKFESLSMADFDQLLFATLKYAPAKTETMQTNTIYANMIKLVAIKDPKAATQMLDSAFENGAWLYGDPNWSAFSENTFLKAYAWIDPELACRKAMELSERYSEEAPVRKLQLLTTVVGELNTIAIRKGMLRNRK